MGFCNKARKKLRADASLSLSHAIIRYLHPFTYILFPHLFSLDTHSIVTIFHARNSNLRDSLRKLDFSVDNTLSTERTTIRIYIYIYTSLSTALSGIASQPRRPCDISFSGSRACNPHVRVRVYNYVGCTLLCNGWKPIGQRRSLFYSRAISRGAHREATDRDTAANNKARRTRCTRWKGRGKGYFQGGWRNGVDGVLPLPLLSTKLFATFLPFCFFIFFGIIIRVLTREIELLILSI